MLELPAPYVPHSASLSPATATQVLATPVPVSAPPTGLDECLFSISLVVVPLAVRFSVSSGCARGAVCLPMPPSWFLFYYFEINDICLAIKKKILFIIFRERGVEGKEKERERNINVWLPLKHPLLGTWPTTQVCALTRNQTGEHLVCRPALGWRGHACLWQD